MPGRFSASCCGYRTRLFRVEFADYGFELPVAFRPGAGSESRLVLDFMSLRKRPDVRNPRKWVKATAAAGAGAFVLGYARHREADGRAAGIHGP